MPYALLADLTLVLHATFILFVVFGGGFIDHYLMPLVYPAGLTSATQFILGLAVLFFNAIIYTLVWYNKRVKSATGPDT